MRVSSPEVCHHPTHDLVRSHCTRSRHYPRSCLRGYAGVVSCGSRPDVCVCVCACVNLLVCIDLCMYVYVCTYIHIYTFVLTALAPDTTHAQIWGIEPGSCFAVVSLMCVCVCVCVFLYVCIDLYVYVHICTYIYIHIYTYIYPCTYIYLYIYIYIYMRIYIFILTTLAPDTTHAQIWGVTPATCLVVASLTCVFVCDVCVCVWCVCLCVICVFACLLSCMDLCV